MATAKKLRQRPLRTRPQHRQRSAPQRSLHEGPTPAPLAAVVGSAPLPRTEIISKLWVYIKANNLQDAANKRNINADAKLKGTVRQTSGFHVRTRWPDWQARQLSPFVQ